MSEPIRDAIIHGRASTKRSIIKAVTYRVVIISLDFAVVYLLTHKVATAALFMIVSNIYTTIAYFIHERVWAGIRWGMEIARVN